MPRTAANVVVKASQLSRAARCRGSSSSWNTVRTSLASGDVMLIGEQYRSGSAALDRLGSGGLGDQALIGIGRCDVRANPVAGEAAVVVAAAGGDQAEIAGEAEQAGRVRLVGVEDLHSGQARRGQ